MKQNAIIVIAVTTLFSANAFAGCENGAKTVFSCMTAKGKQIQVCDVGKTIEYSFGKPQAKPEIVVKVPRSRVTVTPWNGMGRFMSNTIHIPNGNTTYSVFSGVYKPENPENDDEPIKKEAGVEVTVNDKNVATVSCSGKNITDNIEDTDLKVAAE